ncbi:XRE family transcriptional regulator [Amycolatopsis suaedae]|uniref:XRE family transcriptional regulator n=2 Tax=Amycolatopsis suaedae TaxID=2510978 RepID=A0A4Q7J531_9PSEU|nr:XRE family transcriptional regulator [Amycolatopsis suaedae]
MAVQGPVMPRRRIANELRRLREESGHTLEHVARELMISTSKLSRLENAQGSPKPRDVRDLIQFYGLAGSQLAAKLTRWVKASDEDGWWVDYSKTLPTGLDAHIAYETEASVARVYTIPVIPVLLQTRDYARAYYSTAEPWWTAGEIKQLVEVREHRKRALDEREDMDPLRLVAVTHEASIRQLVGSKSIMREQLDYLVERSTHSNIELRVFPFSTPSLFTSTGMYAYFEFPDELDDDIVNIETHAGFRYIESPETVAHYREYYEELYRHALDPEDTRSLLRKVRDESFG